MYLFGQLWTKDQTQDEDELQYESMISVPYQVVQKMVSRSMVRNPLPLCNIPNPDIFYFYENLWKHLGMNTCHAKFPYFIAELRVRVCGIE